MDDSRHCKPIGTLLPPAARPLQIDIYMMRPMPASTRPESGNDRVLSLIDRLVEPADQALRTLFRVHQSGRPYPAEGIEETVDQPDDRRKVAGLMRVNHSGEVAAQALYQGQAFVARDPDLRESLLEAGREEADHLAWCSQRVREMGGRTSLLDPLWYAGSFAIGALAGACGDRVSLGFLVETERQVEGHLDDHLARLPTADARSRRVLEQMKSDEIRHGNTAHSAGAAELPGPVKLLMKLTSRVMTRTAYWL